MNSQIIPYHEPSVAFAKEITKGCKTRLGMFRAIIHCVSTMFRYDYIRAIQIANTNTKPDIQRTWEKRMGVCQDIAAMTTGMLRGVGINAKMCIGKADKRRHAWVEAEIDGRRFRYDHSGKAQVYKTERTY